MEVGNNVSRSLSMHATALGSRPRHCLAHRQKEAMGLVDPLCARDHRLLVALADLLHNILHLVKPAPLMGCEGVDHLQRRQHPGLPSVMMRRRG